MSLSVMSPVSTTIATGSSSFSSRDGPLMVPLGGTDELLARPDFLVAPG